MADVFNFERPRPAVMVSGCEYDRLFIAPRLTGSQNRTAADGAMFFQFALRYYATPTRAGTTSTLMF